MGALLESGTNPEDQSGRDRPSPEKDDGTILMSILHRRDRRDGKFRRLWPDDRQLYLPFVRRNN